MQVPAQSTHERPTQPRGRQTISTSYVSLPSTARGGDSEQLSSNRSNVLALKPAGDTRLDHSQITEQPSTALPSQVLKVKPEDESWSQKQPPLRSQALSHLSYGSLPVSSPET